MFCFAKQIGVGKNAVRKVLVCRNTVSYGVLKTRFGRIAACALWLRSTTHLPPAMDEILCPQLWSKLRSWHLKFPQNLEQTTDSFVTASPFVSSSVWLVGGGLRAGVMGSGAW